MHVVVPNSNEQDCVVLDWTGRDWAELLGLHCSALHLTELDSNAIDLYGPGLRWIEMYLAGRE